ncbi:hypothetical protein ACI8AG_01300 [Blastococcus sp. SYSU DS0552]
MSGPISDEPLLHELCTAFEGSVRWAVNVSVVDEIGRGLFHQVWERDAPDVARTDFAIEGTAASDRERPRPGHWAGRSSSRGRS